MKRLVPIAVLCAAVALILVSPSFSGGQTEPHCTATLKDGTTAVKRAWSIRHWRDGSPVNKEQARTLRAVRGCVSGKDRKELARYAHKKKGYFNLYQRYRRVAHVRCQSGPYGFWVIPCYIIECESHFSWSAHNPSSTAKGPYQILAWVPYPARSFRDKVINHEVASTYSLSAWLCR